MNSLNGWNGLLAYECKHTQEEAKGHAAILRTDTLRPMNTTLYRGGSDNGRWWTEDRDHAAYFGEVSSMDLECDDDRILHLDADEVERFWREEMDGRGMMIQGEDEEALDEMAYHADGYHDWICLHDWEGDGRVFFEIR